MARLPDDYQLIALGLLSAADDEGYFRADPNIVRADVAPFRESLARIRESLAELSRVGWIILAKHPEQGEIGKITNWEKHQRVDHARSSQLKGYFLASDSRDARETLALDQGSGIRDQGSVPKGESVDASINAPSILRSEAKQDAGKPREPTGRYHKDSRAVLYILNEAVGKHFRETDANLRFISARLNEPEITIDGVRAMLLRQAAMWKGTPQADYLRPETLFNKTKFESYYANRDQAIIRDNERTGVAGVSASDGTANEGRGAMYAGAASRLLAKRNQALQDSQRSQAGGNGEGGNPLSG